MKIAILGAGGFAREVACNLLDIGVTPQEIIFVDDVTSGRQLRIKDTEYIIVKNWKFPPRTRFLIGLGTPKEKQIMVTKAAESGLKPLSTVIHPKALIQDADIGLAGVITANVVVTTNVKIGNYVILNLGTTVGHNAILNDYVTCNPSAGISGNVTIGEGTLVGVGACIRENISIGKNCIIGGQSFVAKDVKDGLTVVGVPAKALQ